MVFLAVTGTGGHSMTGQLVYGQYLGDRRRPMILAYVLLSHVSCRGDLRVSVMEEEAVDPAYQNRRACLRDLAIRSGG